jgi:hypothetical protein
MTRISAKLGDGKAKDQLQYLIVIAILLSSSACNRAEQRGLPAEVEATIGRVTEEIGAERYEKVYNESADLWKQDSSLEQSIAQFKTLQTKLGKVENRTLHSAVEQHNTGGPLQGHAYIVTYRSKFEKGEGMETFTLIERGNQWQLARYFVNSTALK